MEGSIPSWLTYWLYKYLTIPSSLHHYIKNIDSLTPKYSELLSSHLGDLKSKRHLCLYPSWSTLDSRVLRKLVTTQWRCTPTSYLYVISVSSYSLVKRTINPYGTQRPTLDITIVLLIMYHLVANKFKD